MLKLLAGRHALSLLLTAIQILDAAQVLTL